MSIENLTNALKAAVGDNLTSYVDKQTGEGIFDYFALAGLSDGLAIVWSDEIGADTHIIKDSGTTAETYGRTSCYHHATNPLAVYCDGYLYATGNNSTEPSVMYFRSTDYDSAVPEAEPSQNDSSKSNASAKVQRSTTPKTGDSISAVAVDFVVMLVLASLGVAVVALRKRMRVK